MLSLHRFGCLCLCHLLPLLSLCRRLSVLSLRRRHDVFDDCVWFVCCDGVSFTNKKNALKTNRAYDVLLYFFRINIECKREYIAKEGFKQNDMKLKVVWIDKSGELLDAGIREWNKETICRKLGFSNADDFACRAQWVSKNKQSVYEVHGKIDGKSRQKTNYRFPFPFENLELVGNALLLKRNLHNLDLIEPVKAEEWIGFLEETHPSATLPTVAVSKKTSRKKKTSTLVDAIETPIDQEKDMEEEAYI